MSIEITDAAKAKLSQLGYNPTFGARPLRRVIQEFVEDGIADLMMEEEDLKKIKIDCLGDQMKVTKA